VTDSGAVLDATFTAIGNLTSTATFKMDYKLSGDSTANKIGFDSSKKGLLTITHGTETFTRHIVGKKNPTHHVGHLEFKNYAGELSLSAWFRKPNSHKHLGDIHAGLTKKHVDVSESAVFDMLFLGVLGLMAARSHKKQ
jgi:hypothetical protein